MLQILLANKYLIKQSNATFYVHYISYITYFDKCDITCMYKEELMMGIWFPKHVVKISNIRNITNIKGCIGLCFIKYLFVR
jgi:hypothetical protein